jgi:hypothetical protein
MKNKKAENAITAVLAAAVLVTGGMSLHSYLSEQRAKNEYDAIRQEVVAEPAAGKHRKRLRRKIIRSCRSTLPNLSGPTRIFVDGSISRHWTSVIRWYRGRTMTII